MLSLQDLSHSEKMFKTSTYSLNGSVIHRNGIKITAPEEILLVCAPSPVDKVEYHVSLFKSFFLYHPWLNSQVFWRRHGRVFRAPDLKSGGPGFKFRSDC